MLKSFLKYPLIATAIAACAAQAQTTGGTSGYLTFGAQHPVRSSYSDCWHTGDWTQERATDECEVKRATFAAELLFGFERAELDEEGRKLLDDMAQKLLALKPERVAVTAHADRIGGAAYNERLSERRAQAIREYLVEKGVPEKLLRVEGKGARKPVTAGHCEGMGPENKRNAKLIACLQPDRRVEIEVAGRHKPVL